MSIVYLLKNQHNHYLDRAGEWVHPDSGKTLFRTIHKDEAINQKVEHTVKDPELRLSVTEASLGDKGKLHINESDLPSTPFEAQVEMPEDMKNASNDHEQDLFDASALSNDAAAS